MKRAAVAIVLSLLGLACKRTAPVALTLSMNEEGGCSELKDNPKFGKVVCWGPGLAATKKFPENINPGRIQGGLGKKLCGIFNNERLACWEGAGNTSMETCYGAVRWSQAWILSSWCRRPGWTSRWTWETLRP